MGEGAVTAILYAVRKIGKISLAVLFVKRTKAEKTVDFVKTLVAGVVFTFLIFKKFIAHISPQCIPLPEEVFPYCPQAFGNPQYPLSR